MIRNNYRVILTKIILNSFISGKSFESECCLKEDLQQVLDSSLRFDTIVSDIERRNGVLTGKVFLQEEEVTKVVEFTVLTTRVT